ncbi:hypothetical protein Scep_013014 [Stephania cephalantha]|uniref:Uncharacterized protein n=1 Tax=Stephania cephalantha TaxID=152367 RepID=A0AAP0JHH1_9MAGN
MASGLFVHHVLEVATFFGKRDEVGEYKAAIANVEKRVGGAVEDVIAVVLVHNLLLPRVRALHSSSSLTQSSREIEIASLRGSKSNGGWLVFYEYMRSLYRENAHSARLPDAVGNFVQAQSMAKC